MATSASLVTLFGISFNVYGAILAVLAIIFLLALWSAHKSGRIDWRDLIVRNGNKASTTKILQLVGGVVGTWIIIQVTMAGTLTWDLFAIYLAYVASVDGFSKLVTAKYGAGGDGDDPSPYRRRSRVDVSVDVDSDDDDSEDDDSTKRRKPAMRGSKPDPEDTRPLGSAKTPGAE